jgi:hypothetical protein
MPGVVFHLVLAEQVLDAWKGAPASAPFDPADPALVAAFQHGALGPDLGYFPGGPRFFSELAHRVQSADLTRTLVNLSRTPMERAFAWGWVTHVVADCDIHPLIGRGVGALLLGDADTFVDGSAGMPEHVRVETGLEVAIQSRFGRPTGRKLTPLFDRQGVGFLVRAYGETYDVDVDPELLAGAHLKMVRMATGALTMVGLFTAARHGSISALSMARGVRRTLVWAREAVADRYGVGRLLLAYLTPEPPARWLMRGVDERIRTFARRIVALSEDGLGSLENRDLSSGRLTDETPVLSIPNFSHS